MKIKDIEYIITIAKYNSFSKASEELYVSQPALSKSISKIEKELNLKIFNRNRKNVSLTEKGEQFVFEGRKILDQFQQFESYVSTLSESVKQEIRIGASQFYSNYLCSEIIPVFNSNHKDIAIQLREEPSESLKSLILNKELDFAIIPKDDDCHKFNCTHLYNERLILAVPNTEKYQNLIVSKVYKELKWPVIENFKELKNEPFHLLKESMSLSIRGTAICEGAGFTPKVINRSQNMETVNKYVSRGHAIAFLSHVITPLESVNYYFIEHQMAYREMVMISNKEVNHSNISIDFLKMSQKILNMFDL